MKNPTSEDMPESFRCNEDKIDKQIQFTVQPKVHKKVGGKGGGVSFYKMYRITYYTRNFYANFDLVMASGLIQIDRFRHQFTSHVFDR